MSVLDIKKPNRALAFQPSSLTPDDISDEEYVLRASEHPAEDYLDLPRVKHRLAALQEAYELSAGVDQPGKKRRVRWLEHQSVTVPKAETIDVEDEFKRELSFYNTALSATQIALSKLSALSVPIWRPDDYLTDMLKTDWQMGSVKQNLIEQKKRVEVVQARRQMKKTKKFSETAHKKDVERKTQRRIQQSRLRHKKTSQSKGKFSRPK
jgi:rRNA-processing protein EBP2